MIRGDGSVLVQHFDQNLTEQDGLYVKSARGTRRKPNSRVLLVPRTTSSAISRSLNAHVLLPLLPFLVLTGYTVVLPLLRRWRRRTRLACPACGYPVGLSAFCTECGAPIHGARPVRLMSEWQRGVVRRLLQAIVLVLLGAIVNMALAWASSLFLMVPIDLRDPQLVLPGGVNNPRGGFEGWRGSIHSGERLVLMPYEHWDNRQPPVAVEMSDFLPRWSRSLVLDPGVAESGGYLQAIDGRGWPFVALAGAVRQPGWWSAAAGSSIQKAGAILLTRVRGDTLVSSEEFRFLPYRPSWPGFVGNTAFYAALLCIIICGPVLLRRVIRRGRELAT